MNCLLRFRDTLAVSALILVLPAVYPVHEAHRFQVSPLTLGSPRSTDVEPELGPQPPCGSEPMPPYPRLDDSPITRSWNKSELGRDWKPPECTGWTALGFTTLVTTVARFRCTSEAQSLLRHFGAISELTGMRYWSTTHKQWQTLIVDAHALTGLQPSQRREDFTPDEARESRILYFEQVDNLSGQAIYRMHIAEVSADRLVIDVETVSTMHYLFIPLFHPGELQSIYFLDRESENVWLYYNIVRTGRRANRLIAGNEIFRDQPGRCGLSLFRRNSHRPGASG